MSPADLVVADLVVADPPEGCAVWAEGELGADLAIPGRPGQVLNGVDPELLDTLDFTAGYLRMWADGGGLLGEGVDLAGGVIALQFADADGAGGLIDAEASLMTLFPDLETFSPVAGSAATGMVLRGEFGYVASYLFALSRYAFWVHAEAVQRDAAVQLVQALAPAQLAQAERVLGVAP